MGTAALSVSDSLGDVAYHLLLAERAAETGLRKVWAARKGRWAHAVILLSASDHPDAIRIIGTQRSRPVRRNPYRLGVRATGNHTRFSAP